MSEINSSGIMPTVFLEIIDWMGKCASNLNTRLSKVIFHDIFLLSDNTYLNSSFIDIVWYRAK